MFYSNIYNTTCIENKYREVNSDKISIANNGEKQLK